jgi:hypothetical protein
MEYVTAVGLVMVIGCTGTAPAHRKTIGLVPSRVVSSHGAGRQDQPFTPSLIRRYALVVGERD